MADEDAIDDLAGKLLLAISAVVDFGRANHQDDELFAAAGIKALTFGLAALVTKQAVPLADVQQALAATVEDMRRG